MSYVHPAWAEHQRQRWLRPDWQRFAKPEPIGRKRYAERLVEQMRVEGGDAVAAEQDAVMADLHRLRWLIKDLKVDLTIQGLQRKYRPDQARDDRGRWVDEGGEGTEGANEIGAVTVTVETEDRMPDGRDSQETGLVFVANRLAVTIDYSKALTGTPTIDKATKDLSEILADTMGKMDFIPEWTPQAYGTAVHVAFGTRVRVAGLEGIGPLDVEHSFIGGGSADYGEAGSIRTDVVLRNIHSEVIAVYDLKTGNADMTIARANQIRESVGVGLNVPIIQLHVLRGASLKSRAVIRKIGAIRARLFNA